MNRSRVTVTVILATLAAGCGGADTTIDEPDGDSATATEETKAAFSEACGQAVEEATNVGDMDDTVEDLDEAIAACVDLDELGQAVERFPAALDGTDLETFVSNRCQFAEDQSVVESAICSEVAG